MRAPKPLKNRAPRCEHGFLQNLCTHTRCPHWDGVRSDREAQRTIIHDSWGKEDSRTKTKKRQH